MKEAGFPQKETAFGQIWYLKDTFVRTCVFVGFVDGKLNVRKFVERHSGITLLGYSMEGAVFAPIAADILKSLGQKYVLWFDESPKVLQWFCAETGDLPSEAGRPFGNENPAEACAEAWLERKAQQMDRSEKLEPDEG